MATAADITNSKSLACPICFEPFNSPRVLPCLHTFCEKCLDSHIKSQIQDGSKFNCPVCKTVTVPPDVKLSVGNWAGAFPLNDVIVYLIETSEDKVVTDDFCGPCKGTGEKNAALFWCLDCQEQLCTSCQSCHKNLKILRHHKTISINERKQEHKPNIQFNFIQNCTRHRGQRLELYCTDHRELCCVVCFASSHRHCDNVRGIADIAEEQERISAYENVNKDVVKIETELNKLLTDRSNKTTVMEQEKNKILHDMDAIVDKVIAKLNLLRRTFQDETKRLHSDKKSQFLKNDKIVRSFLQNIANFRQILDRIEQITLAGQKFVLYENVRSQITSQYQELKSLLETEKEDVHFTLKPNSLLMDLDTTLLSLGAVEMPPNTSAAKYHVLTKIDDAIKNLNLRTKMSRTICSAQVGKIDFMKSPVTFVKSVTREKLGKSTYFTAGACLSNGRLVMADCNNYRLVELDNQYNFVKEYKMDRQPTDVKAGNKDLYIAVGQNSVCKCTLDSELTVTSRIKAPTNTWGIAVIEDNIIVSTKQNVYVMTQEGTTVNSISLQRGGSYVDSFTATKRTQREFYHTDGNVVICRTLEGEEKFKYTHEQLSVPFGMCVDTFNNLYVCGYQSKNIHQVSPEGTRGRILLNQLHSIFKPYNVVFNPQKNELIVTSCNEDTVFEVYRLNIV